MCQLRNLHCRPHLRFMTTIERVALVTLACEGRQLCLAVCPLLSCNASAVSILPTCSGCNDADPQRQTIDWLHAAKCSTRLLITLLLHHQFTQLSRAYKICHTEFQCSMLLKDGLKLMDCCSLMCDNHSLNSTHASQQRMAPYAGAIWRADFSHVFKHVISQQLIL